MESAYNCAIMIMQIIQDVRISEGQIVRALFTRLLHGKGGYSILYLLMPNYKTDINFVGIIAHKNQYFMIIALRFKDLFIQRKKIIEFNSLSDQPVKPSFTVVNFTLIILGT